MSIKILNVGSINMDLVVNLNKMPVSGETVFGDKYSYIPGGKGANLGVAAARLGAEVTFLGRVGDDEFGRTIIENFKNDNINTNHIFVDKQSSTGLAVIPVESNGQNRIIVISGANMKIETKDVYAAFENGNYDAVTIGLEVPLDIVYQTYKYAKDKNIPVILDAGPAMKFDLEPLKGIKVLSPNESECYAMTGIEVDTLENAKRACELLYSQSQAQNIVLKLGSRGAYLYTNGKGKHFSAAENIKVADTTAAGDCFTAALAVMLTQTGDIEKAVKYGNAAAAICVSRFGAQPSLPYKHEVII